MRIISKKILRDFCEKNPTVEQQLKFWHKETCNSEWKNAHDVKRDFPSASILRDQRVVFNIKGNGYRLIVRINYSYQMVWIRFVGTHAEYDQIDALKI